MHNPIDSEFFFLVSEWLLGIASQDDPKHPIQVLCVIDPNIS